MGKINGSLLIILGIRVERVRSLDIKVYDCPVEDMKENDRVV